MVFLSIGIGCIFLKSVLVFFKVIRVEIWWLGFRGFLLRFFFRFFFICVVFIFLIDFRILEFFLIFKVVFNVIRGILDLELVFKLKVRIKFWINYGGYKELFFILFLYFFRLWSYGYEVSNIRY